MIASSKGIDSLGVTLGCPEWPERVTSWTLEGQTWGGFVWFEGLVARGVREGGEEEWLE